MITMHIRKFTFGSWSRLLGYGASFLYIAWSTVIFGKVIYSKAMYGKAISGKAIYGK